MLRNVTRVARKELNGFFSSPVAYIFLTAFLAVSLFVFFWADSFFARNIADVRPLFEWMPLLLVFLVGAVTMRMWSDERQMGTIELLMTMPVRPVQYLLGKFLAAFAMVLLALLLTLPLPLSIAFIGPLDWGPVWGGYLAALFLAAAYIAIGLYLSLRCGNQVVSLIATVLVGAIFYLLGSDLLTGFFSNRTAEILRLFGTGSRFASITRGVVDLRDLYYYLSLTGVFSALSVYTLERLRWARPSAGSITAMRHRRWALVTLLLVANLLTANFWLQNIERARFDLTQNQLYSISPATERALEQLREPLLIRGYFSAKTHPLLAPLVPRLQDLIREYQVAGEGRVKAEFIDPQSNPDLEAEANQKYAIKPMPFQIADRYQTSLVNAYFQILVKYGDQFEVLDFRDLIDVKQSSEMDLDVELRNPEYELTRSIKKVLKSYQGGGDLYASLERPVTLRGYISADDKLPKFLRSFREELDSLSAELQKKAGGQLQVEIRDPAAAGGSLARKIQQEYGFQPMQAGLFSNDRFYFYLTLDDRQQVVPVPLPEEFTRTALRSSIDDALKRFSSGYLKTIALAVPEQPPSYLAAYGMAAGGRTFSLLRQQLEANHNVLAVDLKRGVIPEKADLLVVAAPEQLGEKGLFAVDQFLMKGGTVVLAASPFKINLGRTSLVAEKQPGPIFDWLKTFGINVDSRLVLDKRNQPFPIPVTRNVSGFSVQEIRMVPYPYFIDLRDEGLNQDVPITAGFDHVLLGWGSPISVDRSVDPSLKTTWLLKSSTDAWTSSGDNLVPRRGDYVDQAAGEGKDRGEKLLGVAVQGRFSSYFKGKVSPLLKTDASRQDKPEQTSGRDAPVQVTGVIDRAPESARIILFSSGDFLADQTLRLAATASGQQDLSSLQLVENSVDWALEDPGLLTIRSRGHYNRMLAPLSREAQAGVEYLNYALSIFGLLAVFLAYKVRSRAVRRRYRQLLEGRV
jgi:ABC-2 type transport system permease protein